MTTMKKKNYTSPVVDILDIKATKLLAGSLVDNGEGLDIFVDDDPMPGDAGDAASPIFDLGDELKGFMTLLMVLMMSLTVSAQKVEPAGPAPDGKTHAMTIQLKNGQLVTYQLQDLSHVTYLPDIGIKVYLKNATTSVDYLFSQMESIEYAKDGNLNSNREKVTNLADYCPEAWRLEYPLVSYDNLAKDKDDDNAATKSQIIVKRTDDYGITYSLEWDNAKVANRWTCYQLHEGNSMSTVKRNDDFKADPDVAVSPSLSDYTGSGFSRGHLCPSADRLCSKEQNKQTFFLTNMQPQYQSHNGGLWGRLEEEVRNFATDDSKTNAHCDTLYIVKAATITDKVTLPSGEVDGVYSKSEVNNYDKLLVPKYFYMALLHYNKATDTYHALAFWTEHIDTNQSVKFLGDYAITIDELEKRTGIDFFCNLPDVIEDEVEAEIDLDFWKLTTSQP